MKQLVLLNINHRAVQKAEQFVQGYMELAVSPSAHYAVCAEFVDHLQGAVSPIDCVIELCTIKLFCVRHIGTRVYGEENQRRILANWFIRTKRSKHRKVPTPVLKKIGAYLWDNLNPFLTQMAEAAGKAEALRKQEEEETLPPLRMT